MCIKKCLFDKASPFYRDITELILRIVLGSFMLTHGWPKVASFSEKSEQFPDPLGIGSFLSLSLAAFAEFFCALLLIIGLFTRFAAFNILVTMIVAGLIFHFSDPFMKKELALLYATCALYFLVMGGNRYSVDEWMRKKIFRKN